MKRQNKNKKGFTLVEMILSLAIIVIIGGVIAGICVSISDSFSTTYNIDDSTDYALLYANGFENSFLKETQGTTGAAGDTFTWSVSPIGGIPKLTVTDKNGSSTAIFEPNFISTHSGDSKWDIRMFYKFDTTTKCVYYKIFVKDNYNRTDYVYSYEGSFWVPRFTERAKQNGVEDSREIVVEGVAMTADTFRNTYHWSDDEVASISSQLDGTYKSVIKYKWG